MPERNDLTLDDINELLKIVDLQQREMRKNRTDAFKAHEKMGMKDVKKMEEDIKYFENRAKKLERERKDLEMEKAQLQLKEKKKEQDKDRDKSW